MRIPVRRLSHSTLLLLVLGLGSLLSVPAFAQGFGALADAQQCTAEKNPERAVIYCDRALRNPDQLPLDILTTAYRASGHARLILYQIKKEDFGRVISDFDAAIKANPLDAVGYRDRGWAYSFTSQNDRVISDYTEAIRLDPNDAATFGRRGFAYFKKGDFDRSLADYSRAWNLGERKAWIASNMCNAYFSKNDLDRALSSCNQAVQLDANFANALDTRGQIYERLGRREDATADFKKALQLNPQLSNSIAGLNRLGATR